MRFKMKELKKLLAVTLAVILSANIGTSYANAATAEDTNPYPYTLFAYSSEEGAITVDADNSCINGNVATNGTIVSSGSINVNGIKTENANEDMIYIFNKVESKYFTSNNIDEHTEDYVLEEININLNVPTEVHGKTTLTGNININTALKAYKTISLYGEIKNTNDSVIFSKYGDIIIDSQNINLNGLIYAPFGNVKITAQNLNLNNVVIIADSITIECSSVNANYSKNVADFVGSSTEDFVIPYEDYVYFLEANSDIYGEVEYDDIVPDELIQISDEISQYSNVEIEYYGDEVQPYITDINDIYGESILSLTDLKYEDIAKKIISIQFNVDSEQITLGKPIKLLDANNVNTYIGFNFQLDESNGYITIATHSREALIKDMVDGESLPEEFGDMYYLSSGEFYYKNGGYYTLDGGFIDETEFQTFLEERKAQYYNLTLNILADLETETIAQLNNIIYINNYDFENETLQKQYNGQSGSGYGGIDDCSKYLKDRYGGTITKSSSKTLSMANFKQSELESGNNCSLAAITRVLYYYNKNGYTKISSSYKKIYEKVKKYAEKYGYTPSKGTFPTKINNIVNDVLKDYGYGKSKCKGIYIWTFNNQVKKEVDNKRPVIMNIARGYYGNHTVTVCGYAVYKRTKKKLGIKTTKTYNMIQVYDSWSTNKRYIDYSAFAYDLITSGFGSFNTVTMKK